MQLALTVQKEGHLITYVDDTCGTYEKDMEGIVIYKPTLKVLTLIEGEKEASLAIATYIVNLHNEALKNAKVAK
jgi:hypothetical protein